MDVKIGNNNHATAKRLTSLLTIWLFVSTGLLGLLLLADEDIVASAAGPTYITSNPYYAAPVTWSEANSPYVLNSSVTIKDGAKLTIEPGVIVKINGNHQIYVGSGSTHRANLWAVGTSTKRIVFTSYHDDTEGGDTNGNGGDTAPAKGQWSRIYFDYIDNINLNRIEHCNIKYANEGIRFEDGSVTVTQCNISYNNYGIRAYGTGVSPTISNCNITNNTNGIYLEFTSAGTSLQSNLIRDNNYGLVCSIVPTVNGNTIVNNSVWSGGESRFIPYNVCLKGDVYAGNTWYSSLSPYIVIGDVTIRDTYLVEIQAGTTLKFDRSDYELHIDGKLTAVGTPNSWITFTSNRANPAKGDWDKLNFNPINANYDDHNKLQYCRIEYASYGVYLYYSSPALIDHNEIENNTYGIRLEGNSNPQTVTYNNFTKNTYPVDCCAHIPALGTNNFTANTFNNVTIGGYAKVSCTWPESESPYIIRDSVYVMDNAKLTIEPGVIVKFDSYKRIQVGTASTHRGDIWAEGTAGKRIVFTSNKDDSAGGDTNGDGGLTSPAKSNWEFIYYYYVSNNANNKWEYCDFKYSNYGLNFYEGEIAVSRCNFSYNTRGINAQRSASKPTISNCNISNNTYGIYLDGTSALTELNSNLISDNNYGLVCNIVPLVNGNTILNNSLWSGGEGRAVPYNVCLKGDVYADNTWYSSLSPYIVIATVNIRTPYRVTIQAGTALKFDHSSYQLKVDGKLTAVGTASKRITFTSNRQNPSKGDWNRIFFEPDDPGNYDPFNKLQYCRIEFASYGIFCTHSSPAVLDNNEIENNTYGIRLEGRSNPTITNSNITYNTYSVDCSAHIPSLVTDNISHNSYNNITVGGYIYDNVIWPESGSPYIVRDNIYIVDTNKLTIDPGVTIKFDSYKRIQVGTGSTHRGDLYAVGTKAKRIIFTSNRDDTEGGDTNNDGQATAPAKGNWEYIFFYYLQTVIFNKLEYCTIKYANYGVYLDDNDNGVTVSHCIIEENHRGIHLQSGAKGNVEYNEFHNNGYGMYFAGSRSGANVHNNDIYGNTNHGIYVQSPDNVSADNNYWGSANGPTHANNPGGNGDKSSNYVDYKPFANYYINNDPPVSKAGQDQTVVWGRNATLDGKGSYDQEECPNGDAAGNKLVYDWNVSANYPSNQIVLNNESSPTPHFTLVMNVSGTYTFTLVVRDPGGKWSSESTVNVHSSPPDVPTELWITQRDLVITADETSRFTAGANDSAGNRNYTWMREWEITDPDAQLAVSGQYNETAVFHPHKAGIWTIRCNYSGGVVNGGRTVTKQITVRFGEVKSIIIETFQNMVNVSADNENLRITATGYDLKGNVNNTWISTWSVNDTDARLGPDPNDPANGQKRVFIPGNVGQWMITCELKEFGFTIVTANIKLNVSHGVVDHIDVTPKDQITTAGSTIQYSAVVYDQKNNSIPSNPTWSTDDPKGNISSGLYGAGQNGTWNIVCTVDQISGSTSVTVNKGPLTGVEITTETATVHANETLQFSARGYDVKDNPILISFTWAVTDPEAQISQQSGLFTPKNVGTFKVFANYTDQKTRADWSAEATIRVLLGRVYSLEITTQDNLKAITVEQKLQLYAKAYDVKGNEYGAGDWTPTWQVDDPDGSVSSTGLFTPGPSSIGIWTITCTDTATNIFNTTSVGVNFGQLSNIVISPSGATVAADKTLQLTATGYDTMNNSQDITHEVAWYVPNGTIENGLFSPYAVGEYTIYANRSGRSGHVTVMVNYGKLVRIIITPDNPSVDVLDTEPLKLKGTGYDIKNNLIINNWNWSISKGTIDPTGAEVTYTPKAPGKWIAMCSYGSIRANITIDVTNTITISHNVTSTAATGGKVVISAVIVGYLDVMPTLYYKYHEEDIYQATSMFNPEGDNYLGDIPGLIDPGSIFYYIVASDGYNTAVTHPEKTPVERPNIIEVTESAVGAVPTPVQFWAWDFGIGDTVKIIWIPSLANEFVTEYKIYYSRFSFSTVEDYSSNEIMLVATENSNSTEYVRLVKNLVANQNYYFAVTPVNQHGENLRVASAVVKPTKLTEAKVDANFNGSYTATWKKCPEELRPRFDHYAIYVATGTPDVNNDSQVAVRIFDILTTSYIIRGLKPDEKYEILIRYMGKDGAELYRETGSIKVEGAVEETGLLGFFMEYWELVGGAITILAALFGFFAFQRKKKKVKEYRKEITDTYMANRKEPAVCVKKLKDIRQRLEEEVHEERMTENQYLIIREKLKDYMAEMKEKNRKLKKKEMKRKMKEKQKALVVVEKMELDEEKEKKPKKQAVVDSGKDYHAVLGVASDATEKEIRAAFKMLAEKYHPDKVRHLGKEIIDVAARNMRELNEARDTLLERLKEGPEPGEKAGDDEAKLSAKEEAESLPVTEIIDEDRMLGQGDGAAESESPDEEKADEGTEKTEVGEEAGEEVKEPAASGETLEAEPAEPIAVDADDLPETDDGEDGSESDDEPSPASDDEPDEKPIDTEDATTTEEPGEDADELFASLDDDLPPPEDHGTESSEEDAKDDLEDDIDELIKMSDDVFDD